MNSTLSNNEEELLDLLSGQASDVIFNDNIRICCNKLAAVNMKTRPVVEITRSGSDYYEMQISESYLAAFGRL